MMTTYESAAQRCVRWWWRAPFHTPPYSSRAAGSHAISHRHCCEIWHAYYTSDYNIFHCAI